MIVFTYLNILLGTQDIESNEYGVQWDYEHKNNDDEGSIQEEYTYMSRVQGIDEIQPAQHPLMSEKEPVRKLSRPASPELGADNETRVRKQNMRENMIRSMETRGSTLSLRNKFQASARIRSAPKSINALKALMSKIRPWYAQRIVHFIILVVMLFLCILRCLFI